METKEKRKVEFRSVLKWLIIIVIVMAAIAFGWANRSKIALWVLKDGQDKTAATTNEPRISVEYISKTIEKISTLQTAKITYGCMIDFEEGKIDILTKKSFSLFYEATAYAGVDVSGIKVRENDGKFVVQLPPAQIEEKPKIDPASFVFYDKKSGLLNNLKPEDVGKALEYAEKDVYKQATTDQLLDLADSNAVEVLKNLLLVLLDEDQFDIVPGERGSVQKLRPPVSSAEVKEFDGSKGYTYAELKQKFEDEGFTNVKVYPIPDIKLGIFAKEGEVESVTIGKDESFKRSSIFNADEEIVIKYHTKLEK